MIANRYAIYFTPAPGPLAAFGAAWLGWDMAVGTAPQPLEVPGLPCPREDITATPRKYGFHATIKPPFRLAEGQEPGDLIDAMGALATTLPPVPQTGLMLSQLGAFLALTAEGDTSALNTLAGRVVEDLDRFRAPPTQAELAKRRANGLTALQDQMLVRWGYPYVRDAFRFHMTLSGPLGAAQAEATANVLRPVLDPILPRPFIVNTLTLVGEGTDGLFREIHRYALSG